MPVKAKVVFSSLEELAPLSLAESWDNCGLQLGNPDQDINAILVTLDVDQQAVALAREKGAGLIVSHHPLFFDGVKTIDYRTSKGSLIKELVSNNISVYAAHTNLDSAPKGLNEVLATRLGLANIMPLEPGKMESLFKVVTFVPDSHLEVVRQALNDAGAGHLGNYCDCSFRTAGTGTFRPLEGSNPFLGQTGLLEEASEFRLETIVPKSLLSTVLQSMLRAHPYEEVAYDVYPLANKGQVFSCGRVGQLEEPLLLKDWASRVREVLDLEYIRVAGFSGQMVRKVAVVAGSGASLIPAALNVGCDVMITGDLKYHETRECLAAGMALIDAGHEGLEGMAVDFMADYLEDMGRMNSWEVTVIRAKTPLLFRLIDKCPPHTGNL